MELFDLLTYNLVKALIPLLLATLSAVAGYVLIYLKNKDEKSKKELADALASEAQFALRSAIRTAVEAAQQTFTADKAGNDAKFIYVKRLALAAAHSLGIVLTDEQLTAMIESTVHKIKLVSKNTDIYID